MKYHRNDIEGKKLNCMLEIDILRNSSKYFGVLSGDFSMVWVSKWHPDDLWAKTMLHILFPECMLIT